MVVSFLSRRVSLVKMLAGISTTTPRALSEVDKSSMEIMLSRSSELWDFCDKCKIWRGRKLFS